MPFPIAPLIAAGAGVAAGAINAGSQANLNVANRNFALGMYNRTREDNLEFWNMQNAYNSPQAQRARLESAGLNPNLMAGNASAGGSAGNIPTPDAFMPQQVAPRPGDAITGGLSAINAIYDLEIKDAQANNLRTQNTVIAQEALEQLQRITESQSRVARTSFDLELDKEFRNISGEMRKEALRQIQTGTNISIDRNAREAVANASSVQEAAVRMLKLRAETQNIPLEAERTRALINNVQHDTTLKQLDIELKQLGLQPGDALWQRVVGRLLNSLYK